MTLSAILGYFSLAGYLGLWGYVGLESRRNWAKSRNEDAFYDHRFEMVRDNIAWALRCCFHNGFLVIEDLDANRFIQFRKYIPGGQIGGHGLEFSFPNAPWSRAYFPKLRDILTAKGIPFREARENRGHVTAFIHVDCGQDVEMAFDLARRCFFDIFGLAPDTRFKSTAKNYSALGDEIVDRRSKNYESLGDFWQALRARALAKGGPELNLVLRLFGYYSGLMFLCFPALWWTWARADAAAPDWQVAMGRIEAAGSHASWVMLLVFWAVWFRCNSLHREFAKCQKPKPRSWMGNIGRRLAAHALPLAVITSWLGM